MNERLREPSIHKEYKRYFLDKHTTNFLVLLENVGIPSDKITLVTRMSSHAVMGRHMVTHAPLAPRAELTLRRNQFCSCFNIDEFFTWYSSPKTRFAQLWILTGPLQGTPDSKGAPVKL